MQEIQCNAEFTNIKVQENFNKFINEIQDEIELCKTYHKNYLNEKEIL